MNMNESLAFEWKKTLDDLSEKNASLKEFAYFLDLAGENFGLCGKEKGKPKAVILGSFFPDEIPRAMGIDFCYVCGGSYESTTFGNVNLPKDVDDVTRSIVGILKSDAPGLDEGDVLLVPLCSDGMNKLKPYLGDLTTVLCYEVPSDKGDVLQRKRFFNEINRITKELKKHFKKGFSSKKLKEECEISQKASEAFRKFEALWKTGKTALSGSAFVFIASSYRMCKNKPEWILHLERLTAELREKSVSDASGFPEIMLLGSPIYAPNYKVLFEIEKLPLRLHTVIHPDVVQVKTWEGTKVKRDSVKGLAKRYLDSDISPVFIENPTLTEAVERSLYEGKIKGVIAHTIRGQIEYDYELKKIEKQIAKYQIPFNRIETVYNYQDVEQLKIRLQAFSEILNGK